jgi:ABC-type branched-subunit amino acid transport system ATPase component
VVALLGRNGAGKSTTFRSIMGLVAPAAAAPTARAPWTPGALFALFPNLAEMRERLSGRARCRGGEQQMLTIARTLMGNPRAVLLDEPSEGSRRSSSRAAHAPAIQSGFLDPVPAVYAFLMLDELGRPRAMRLQ